MKSSVRFSCDQYEEMIRLGLFNPPERHRVELIFGKLVPVYGKRPMSPPNPPHDYVIDRLNQWSFEVLPLDAVWVRVQGAIGIPGLESVPQPDLVWLAREEFYNRRPMTEHILLIVEVSDSTLRKDRGRKAKLYAQAGLRDYWVVDVQHRRIEVRRDPVGSKYQSLTTYDLGDRIHPLAFPEVSLVVARLFPE
jgi:Uma2 family endonuclease